MDKKPEWLKVRYNQDAVNEVAEMMRELKLNTVCKEANCPNLGECYRKHTSTFMILGSVCTRNCRFCNVTHARPEPPDPDEPMNVAVAAKKLGLRHVVLTCPTRDDLPDGGAAHWAECVRAIRAENPDVTIELLIPDLDAKPDLLDTVIASGPDIIGHNIETTEQLTPLVRSRARYRTSLDVLRYLSEKGAVAKSGLMVGLGESDEEVLQTLRDLHAAGVEIVTLGQYLRPTLEHHPVAAYITPEKFDWYRQQALDMGFSYCASGPMVRSSYLADEALGSVRLKRQVSAKA